MGELLSMRLPLSAAQLGIWLGQQMVPDSPAYWTAEAIELHGALDVEAFESAVLRALAECEALHMHYGVEDGQVYQTPTASLPHLLQIDCSANPDAAWQLLDEALQKPLDLARDALFDTALLRLGQARHVWVLRAHHIALDGYAYALLARRIAALYSGRDEGAARVALADVVAEANAYQDSPAMWQDRAFWQAQLADMSVPVTLAPRQPMARSVRRVRGQLPEVQLADWQAAAAKAGVDWSAWCLAMVAAWLHRETGARQLILGLPSMARMGSLALTVPCMAMNIVPLCIEVDEQAGLAVLAQQIMATLRALRPHQRYRYEWLRHDLGGLATEGKQRPLFGPVVNLMPFDRPPVFGDLVAVQHPVSAGPVEDISFSVVPQSNGIRLDIDANPQAYSASALVAHQAALIQAIAALQATPTDQPLHEVLGHAPDRRALLSGGALPHPAEDVLAALQRHAALTPTQPAIEQAGCVLSYAALLSEVKQLAGVLRAQGVVTDTRVALLLPRVPNTLVAMLAVLWAGGGYVPLDVDSPPARIAAVLGDAKPALLLTTQAEAAKLNEAVPMLCLDQALPAAAPCVEPAAVGASALAYVIYTSGSTGRPNGVMISRAALAHFVAGAGVVYAMTSADRVLQFSPLHFDASVEEIYVSLCHGATVVLRTDAMLESLPRLMAACAEQRISVLDLPTALWHELAYSIGSHGVVLPEIVRLVIIGGEAALAERVTRWREHTPAHVVLLNTYGPTEATVICTTARLSDAGVNPDLGVPIGVPLPGVAIAVVDEHLNPLPVESEGELCLMGGGLANGYFEREEVSAARFITLTALANSPRAYRSGDRVRLGADGQLYYLGRLDDELKISGHRIDPTEIETTLLSYPSVREAAVVGQVVPDGGKRLVAFLVSDESVLNTPSLQDFLGERLPTAAIPAHYVLLPRLPRNANGKIDRKVLREQSVDAAMIDTPLETATATPLERAIIEVWQAILGVVAISPADDFFALGGKSLQAIQVANRIGLALQRDVPVSALFAYSTVSALANALSNPHGHRPPVDSDPFAPLLCLAPGVPEKSPLFCVHPAEGLAWCYMGLARHLAQLPLYGLQAPGISGTAPASIEALVADYVQRIRSVQPTGAYRFLGWSSGGGIAHAIAVALQEQGAQVELLAMMDSYPSDIWAGKPPPTEADALIALLDVIGESAIDEQGQPLSVAAMRARLRRPSSTLALADEARMQRLADVAIDSMLQYRELRHGVFRGELHFFKALQRRADAPDWAGWQPYVSGNISVVGVDSTHNTMSQAQPLAQIGSALAHYLG